MELKNLIFETSGMNQFWVKAMLHKMICNDGFQFISISFHSILFIQSERMGLSKEQRIECAGICAFHMAVQVLGT